MEDEQRPQFGNRFLKDKNQVFAHNAWDNVVWDEEQEASAQKKVSENSEITFSAEEINELENLAANKWDEFYMKHQNRFFKDRHWVFTEFIELENKVNSSKPVNVAAPWSETLKEIKEANRILLSDTKKLREDEKYPGENSSFKILEVGCGVGNTVFPILERNIDPQLFMYCCDFSNIAINIVKENTDYNTLRCNAFVCDLTSDDWPTPFPEDCLDIVICIFVLSALHPVKIRKAIKKLAQYLKPGGLLIFRDYGRYDLAQLRFKNGKSVGENIYARGDGTMCYFFTQNDVKEMMSDAGLEEVQNLVDRRLQVNRGKQLTMYRVWLQAKYRKPL